MRYQQHPHHPVLDHILDRFPVKNDAAIARLIGFKHARLSKIRHGMFEDLSDFAVAVHEVFGLTIAEITELLGRHPSTLQRFAPKTPPGKAGRPPRVRSRK